MLGVGEGQIQEGVGNPVLVIVPVRSGTTEYSRDKEKVAIQLLACIGLRNIFIKG